MPPEFTGAVGQLACGKRGSAREWTRNDGRARVTSDTPLPAQIGLLHILVLEQAFGGILERHAAGLEHVPAYGDRQRHVRVLLDEQHRDTAGVDVADGPEDLPNEQRRESE